MKLAPKTQVQTMLSQLEQVLMEGVKGTASKYYQYEDLLTVLEDYLVEPYDFYVLATVIEEVLLPTNTAMQKIPVSEGLSFAKTFAKGLLDAEKEKALSNLIREWDMLTEDICLNRERDVMVELFKEVRDSLEDELDQNQLDILMTAMIQEFERRLGQKRKSRAGQDLESATSFILDYFGFKSAEGPEHFATSIEVDNWVKDKKGWYIGISLKRTLRERWKQTFSTELARHKVKYVIHLLNNDRDLSDSKISEMGTYNHIFFVADDSKVLETYKDHPALGQYLFPMSSLVKKLREWTA